MLHDNGILESQEKKRDWRLEDLERHLWVNIHKISLKF